MSKTPVIFLVLLLHVTITSHARLFPVEAGTLHYRIIGFSTNSDTSTSGYVLDIAAGYINSIDSFRKHLLKTVKKNSNHIIAEVPAFGQYYTWMIHTGNNNSELRHFRVMDEELPGSQQRLRILKGASAYENAYIFLDGSKALYDMKGNAVWVLPPIGGLNNADAQVRDMKITGANTITLFINDHPYEINYNGDIIWEAPDDGQVNGEQAEHYHHEFTRLSNGHYMVMGSQTVIKKVPMGDGPPRQATAHNTSAGSISERRYYGTLIEYDSSGNIVWSWRSSEHFNDSGVVGFAVQTGANMRDPHDNSFYFDEVKGAVYISYKGLNGILKIKYPEGKILNFFSGSENMFCGQHSIRRSSSDHPYLYNNNDCNDNALPSVLMFKEPNGNKGKIEKVWEYTCPVETNIHLKFPKGGNVYQLSDMAMLICMGSAYSKVFIVDTNKTVLWSALPEKWDDSGKKWKPLNQYRASIIENKHQLEKLIGDENTLR